MLAVHGGVAIWNMEDFLSFYDYLLGVLYEGPLQVFNNAFLVIELSWECQVDVALVHDCFMVCCNIKEIIF